MNLKFLIFAVAVAAMGPARDAPPPDPDEVESRPMSPEEVPGAAPTVEAAPELAERPATDVAMADFRWTARPVVVFADSADDPSFVQQMRMLRARPDILADRDVVVITDTDPAAATEWRRQLHPRGFSVVIIEKDGQVQLRKPLPWDVIEISRAIDKFPLRRQEIGRAGVLP